MARKRVAAGIDVSSKELHAAIHGIAQVSTFTNDESGHKKLASFLKKRGRLVHVVLESTGTYGLDIALALHASPRFEVRYVNPMVARNFARVRLGRAKTDRVDARLLAEMGATLDLPPWQPPTAHAQALRAVTRRIRSAIDDRTREKNRLKAAQATTTTPTVVIEDITAHIEAMDRRVEQLRQAAVELARQDPECSMQIDLLTSIKGIGDATAVEVLGEIRCLPRDLTAKQLVAQAGLDPRAKQSGKHDGPRRISKMGSRQLRCALFIAAHNAIRWCPVVRRRYEVLTQGRHKHKLVARVAIARKLVHTLHGMIATRTRFDPMLFTGPEHLDTFAA